MKFLASLILILALTSCGTVTVKTPDGFEFSSRTLWKDIEAANFQTDDFVGELGSSKSADEARTLMAMCLLFPQMEGCG
jgi:hypothetical protein